MVNIVDIQFTRINKCQFFRLVSKIFTKNSVVVG